MTNSVPRGQRFSRDNPCPVCQGHSAGRKGERCWGFLSDDGRYAHCTREEHAGTLQSSTASTFAHFLNEHGQHVACKCDGTAPEQRENTNKPPRQQHTKAVTTTTTAPPTLVHDYHDEHGTLLYQVTRRHTREGKRISQRRPGKGNEGEWVYSLQGVRRVLYHLPDLLANDPATIWVLEGETCVDFAREWGLAATCSPCGSKQFNRLAPGQHEIFRGRHVVIWPDNDQPGTDHATQVAETLEHVAASCKVINVIDLERAINTTLPTGGDIVDWAAAGGTVEQLLQIVAATPDLPRDYRNRRTWTLAELLAADIPPQRWIVQDLLPDTGLVALGGKKKLGKSWMALQISQAVAAGGMVLGKEAEQRRVLHYALEDGVERLQSRLKLQDAGEWPAVFQTTLAPLDQDGLRQLETDCQTHQPGLVVIDTIAAAKTGKTDENSAGDMADLYYTLQRLAVRMGFCLITVVHHGKSTTGDPGFDIRGSSATAGATDLTLGLYREAADDDEEASVCVLRGEGRDIEEFDLRVRFDGDLTWLWHAEGEHNKMRQMEANVKMVQALRDLGGQATGRAITEATGLSRMNTNRRLKELVREGRVECVTPAAGNGRSREWRLVEETDG